MGAKISNDEDVISEINIVPFVDIILVVLIIFMVTTPIMIKPSLNIALPKSVSGDKNKPSELNVVIDAKQSMTFNGKPVSKENLSAWSKEIAQGNPAAKAIISADKNVPHGVVIGIIDTIKSSGIKRFAVTVNRVAAKAKKSK